MHCVDLGESFPTSIYLQNLASIQPRTSPTKTIPDTPIPTPPPPLKPTLTLDQGHPKICLQAGGGEDDTKMNVTKRKKTNAHIVYQNPGDNECTKSAVSHPGLDESMNELLVPRSQKHWARRNV